MSTIVLNYDSKFDILYARLPNGAPSYGDEIDGIVTYYSIATDAITGMAIYNAKQRIQKGSLSGSALPIPLDLAAGPLQMLLTHPEKGFKYTLQLA